MKYALLIYSAGTDEEWEALSEAEQGAIYGEYRAVSESPGVIDGHQLQPAATATTVRIQNGKSVVTDGPFIEAKERIGGYAIVSVPSLDEAITLAKSWPAGGTVEVRPVVERPGM